MGCDIHMYIQYKEKRKDKTREWWRDFGGYFSPGRNYTMFGILAGVRDNPEKGFEPKGLPEFELSYGVMDDLYMYVDSEERNTCTLEQAERWGRRIEKDKDGNPWRTEHPDWHSHSWMTAKELAQAYRWYKKETDYKPSLEYRVILKIMKALEDDGKNEVALVFWFDN